jgi:hypothetical protein
MSLGLAIGAFPDVFGSSVKAQRLKTSSLRWRTDRDCLERLQATVYFPSWSRRIIPELVCSPPPAPLAVVFGYCHATGRSRRCGGAAWAAHGAAAFRVLNSPSPFAPHITSSPPPPIKNPLRGGGHFRPRPVGGFQKSISRWRGRSGPPGWPPLLPGRGGSCEHCARASLPCPGRHGSARRPRC